MLIKNPIPAYFLPQNKPRGWFAQDSSQGNLISRHNTRKAPPRPLPAGSDPALSITPTAITNRLWHHFMCHAWKAGLTSGQRAAWSAAAPAFTIKNHYGVTKTPKGFQLFVWWNSYQPNYCWAPPYPFNPIGAGYTSDPPDSTLEKPVPDTLALDTHTPPTFKFTFNCTTDLSLMSAFLQMTRPNRAQNNPFASQWRRLGPLPLTSHAGFNPTYPGAPCPPVPPWTDSPTYTPAHWNVDTSSTVTYSGPASTESIRAGLSQANYSVNWYARLNSSTADTNPLASWGIDPATGARYGVIIQGISPPGHPETWTYYYSLVSYASWTADPTILVGPSPFHMNSAASIPYSLDITDTEATFTTPYGNLVLTYGSPPPKTDAGWDQNKNEITLESYMVSGTAGLWSAEANYQNILENPLNPGPRAARLTLGDPDTGNNLHSDWIPATLEV